MQEVKVGATLPNYELKDHTGKKRKLSAIPKDSNAIPRAFLSQGTPVSQETYQLPFRAGRQLCRVGHHHYG